MCVCVWGGGGGKNVCSSQKLPPIDCYQAFSEVPVLGLFKKHQQLYSPQMIPTAKFSGSGSWTIEISLNLAQMFVGNFFQNLEFFQNCDFFSQNCELATVSQTRKTSCRQQNSHVCYQQLK